MSDAKLLHCPPVNLLASKGDPSEDMTTFNSLFFFADLSFWCTSAAVCLCECVFHTGLKDTMWQTGEEKYKSNKEYTCQAKPWGVNSKIYINKNSLHPFLTMLVHNIAFSTRAVHMDIMRRHRVDEREDFMCGCSSSLHSTVQIINTNKSGPFVK